MSATRLHVTVIYALGQLPIVSEAKRLLPPQAALIWHHHPFGLSVEGVWERRSGSAGAHHEVRDMLRIRGRGLNFATPNEHRLSGLGRSERLLGYSRERTYLELNVKLIYLLN